MKTHIHEAESSGLSRTAVKTVTYSVAEAAAVLGVSHASIYRLVIRRLLKPLPGLRTKRLPKEQVHRFARGTTI